MNSKLLKKTQLFHSLTDEEMEQIINKMILKQFKKNEIILYEEDTNEFMYVILLGKVKVVRTTEDGKEIILAIHKSGSFFGEMSLIDGKTSPASVIAIENVQIALLAKKDFFSIVFLHNKVTGNLLKILCTRLRRCWDTIQLLNFNNASNRTKMLLLMLTEEHGEKTPEGTILNIRLTHQNISDMTGLTRESVTRVIDKLQKQKEIIVLKNRFICLTHRFMRKDVNIPTS
ncbi:global nitrogen regulator [bacterium BMS3Abin09]|nr:global nitrogen regulator [bacterium BMS3Abin09]GBE40546.1 global nitrogen regulator [bacterium BMS3Bbin09]